MSADVPRGGWKKGVKGVVVRRGIVVKVVVVCLAVLTSP